MVVFITTTAIASAVALASTYAYRFLTSFAIGQATGGVLVIVSAVAGLLMTGVLSWFNYLWTSN